jgi:hypothetical protein
VQAAQSVALAWDASTASDIAGYRLYAGTTSGVYTQQIDVGNNTSTSVSDLVDGTTYFFAITDYTTSGVESARSNEVSYTAPIATPTPTPTPDPTPTPTPAPSPTPTPDPTPSPTPTPTRSTKADFNGDHKSDILWQDSATGGRAIWLMNGSSYLTGVNLGFVPTQWQIAGTGDFNGNGKTDILWQNTATGERVIWLMNGASYSRGVSLGVVPTQWRIAGTGDFNRNGKTDILWENTATGERAIWLMNGASYSRGVSLGVVPTQWEMRNH